MINKMILSLGEPSSAVKTANLVFALIASLLICATYIPGAYKIWKTNDTRGTSILMYILCEVACSCWIVAGIIGWAGGVVGPETAVPLIFSNLFVLFCAGLVLHKKAKFMAEAKKLGKTEYDYVSEVVEKTKNKIPLKAKDEPVVTTEQK